MTDRDLTQRITDYLTGGGLFNPEMANHEAVRDLLIECRDALAQPEQDWSLLKATQGSLREHMARIKELEAQIVQYVSLISEGKTLQEPVAWMRMPKEGDRVVCIEDESLGTVKYLTGGGSPDITFDDGSHGVYLLREFAELFRYADTAPPRKEWVGLTGIEVRRLKDIHIPIYSIPILDDYLNFYRAIENELKDKNTTNQ